MLFYQPPAKPPAIHFVAKPHSQMLVQNLLFKMTEEFDKVAFDAYKDSPGVRVLILTNSNKTDIAIFARMRGAFKVMFFKTYNGYYDAKVFVRI